MNNTDESVKLAAAWWFAMVVILIMGYLVTAEAEVEYAEDNTTGEYYLMEVGCEIFDPVTGKELSDDNESKCQLFYYKNGVPVRPVDPTKNRNYRERMYNDEQG